MRHLGLMLLLATLVVGCGTAPTSVIPADRPMVCYGVGYAPDQRYIAIATDASGVVVRELQMERGSGGARFAVLAGHRFDCDPANLRQIERQLRHFAEEASWDQSVPDGPHYLYYVDGKLVKQGYSRELHERLDGLLMSVVEAELKPTGR